MAERVAAARRRGPESELIGFSEIQALPILMVDDRPGNLQTLESSLEPLGVALERAASGEEALRRLLEQDFALILLDVRMPGMDGLQTAELIKRRPRSAEIPIVLMTGADENAGEIVRGYGIGAVDYVVRPFDPDLLRAKVSVFLELDRGRRALERSEAFLSGAFEAAPIGKTVLDSERRILRANPAFAQLLGRETSALSGTDVLALCHPQDRTRLGVELERTIAWAGEPAPGRAETDVRLLTEAEAEVWTGAVISGIIVAEDARSMLLIQWVDLTARRRAEQARADLLREHSARTEAEALAERLKKLQTLSAALESLQLEKILPELALRLAELFEAQATEVSAVDEEQSVIVVRSQDGRIVPAPDSQELEAVPTRPQPATQEHWEELPVVIDHTQAGLLRLRLDEQRSLGAAERSLLRDAAERAALAIRRARLHAQEHRIAAELQRGLVPTRLPELPRIEIATYYRAAGAGAVVGGDWYDAFALDRGRLGVVLGDVAGRGIPAASAMGQLRSVTRAFALVSDGRRTPGEVLSCLNSYQLALGADEMFTEIYAIVDPEQGEITWANAGHLPPVVRSTSGEVEVLEGGDGLVGIQPVTYRNLRLEAAPPATLVLYTDGLVERRGESLDVGLARLAHAVSSGPDAPAALCQHLRECLLEPGQDQQDDVTAMVVRLG